ncbi:peptide deformylase [Catellatospora citrea]|uniref:Peptide deformylase n=1 Tax=Catellatospora citrea TaxID=53366 RepID=A0A8J3KIU0_9ACTN|nr:peptide deformylase [Catellatospora citrea]RKE10272.1 peptide deformylase [Catellatospora citrea]GIF97815.1 peptide deformylase 4 [Catellatospora citrea]
MSEQAVRPGIARDITLYGTPVLHRPTAPVTDFGPDLHQLVADMFASMYAANGVGLAANQIGVGLRVFVMDCPDPGNGANVVAHVVNPVLALPAPPRELEVSGEGCLSVPGQRGDVARTALAVVTGVDMHGEPVRVEGTGLVARCLQHETDHLDGTVYVDRLTAKERKKILNAAGLPLS